MHVNPMKSLYPIKLLVLENQNLSLFLRIGTGTSLNQTWDNANRTVKAKVIDYKCLVTWLDD